MNIFFVNKTLFYYNLSSFNNIKINKKNVKYDVRHYTISNEEPSFNLLSISVG